MLNCVLDWLDRLKPLWEFLTGIGTVALAVLTVYLANRKPKSRITVTVRLAREHVAVVEMLNVGDALPVVRGWHWSSPRTGRIDLLAMVNLTIQARPVPIPYRMERGDLIEGQVALEAIAQLADERLGPNATPEEVQVCVRESRFGCTTTVGQVFEVSLPPEVRTELARRIDIRRRPI